MRGVKSHEPGLLFDELQGLLREDAWVLGRVFGGVGVGLLCEEGDAAFEEPVVQLLADLDITALNGCHNMSFTSFGFKDHWEGRRAGPSLDRKSIISCARIARGVKNRPFPGNGKCIPALRGCMGAAARPFWA
jgi:hypothetical protein